MAAKNLPPLTYLDQCFHYSPSTGALTWKTRPREHFKSEQRWKAWNSTHAGKNAGTVAKRGYIHACINRRKILAHRIVFKIMTGNNPPTDLDHRDHNPSNNRWNNLRLATRTQNQANQKLNLRSTSGLKGVSPTPFGTFASRIHAHGKTYCLGTFQTAEEANEAYCKAAQELFGKFWCNGKR